MRLPLPGDSKPLVLGQVLSGMNPTDKPVAGTKNDPLMPIAWIKTYQGAKGQSGRVFTTTRGAATDLESEGLRRLLVNGVYWCVGLEDKIPPRPRGRPAEGMARRLRRRPTSCEPKNGPVPDFAVLLGNPSGH